MTETVEYAYENIYRTEKDRRIEKEPVIAVAVVDAAHHERWDGSGYIRAEPITLDTTLDNSDNPFGAPAVSLDDHERLVSAVPVSGMWCVWWVPESDSEHDVTHLGYEYEGATGRNWDWVIEDQIIGSEEDSN